MIDISKGKLALLDFEYNNTTERVLNLVCVSVDFMEEGEVIERKDFWLHSSVKEQIGFTNYINQLVLKGCTLVAFGVIAEAGALLSLPHPLEVQTLPWIDLWLEYRNLLNHNHKFAYGEQLIEGRISKTYPPKPWSTDEKVKSPDGLGACCYKLLDVMIDTDEKKKVRDIIIHGSHEQIEGNKKRILKYCRSDIKYMYQILQKILKEYKRGYKKKHREFVKGWMLSRGEFAARTAIMERQGYPINYEDTKNFSDNVGTILGEIQGEINELFPDIKPFRYKVKEGKYSWNQIATREWIEKGPYASEWTLTKPSKRHPKGQLSLSADAFFKKFPFRHNYPKENLGAQFVRYLKTKQNLNGFVANPEKDKKTLWNYVGRDGWVRPYTNIYRSQSSRSQPSATSFMFLKSAWMRSLVQPPSGYAMGGIDYGSEEFLIAGLVSGDKNMIEAYDSGDVYLWFGKEIGKIPKEATKKTHGKLRDRFKSSVLGIQYLMGAKALASKITNDTGMLTTEEEAQEIINMFDELFWRYAEWKDEFLIEYGVQGYMILKDGWTMWGDNANFRSIANCPIQGMGGVIMRGAVANAQDCGLNIPFTLHDALYQISPTWDILDRMDVLASAMDRAFKDAFPGQRDKANVRLDGNIWSMDFEDKEEYVKTPGGLLVKKQKIYVDDRGREEYEKFSKFFKRDEIMDLL